MPEPPSKVVRDGRYALVRPLGQGSQGTTWDALDSLEDRHVAIKAFDVSGARTWKDVELAEREVRVLSELSHPLLPRYIEHFEEEGVLYLVMEKILGTPLSALQRSGARMTEAELVRLLDDADHALTYLHTRAPPVVHRDLKPSNVLRREDGSHAFVDFGAVSDRLRPEGGSTVVGTFGYMAPEQMQARARPASDVYSIGATAMALLTGQEPEKLPHKGLSIDVRAALGETVSPRLQAALARMLEPDPDTRAPHIGPLLAGAESQPSKARPTRERPRATAGGASDVRGPRSANLQVGTKRTKAFLAALVAAGVAVAIGAALIVKGAGPRVPFATARAPEGPQAKRLHPPDLHGLGDNVSDIESIDVSELGPLKAFDPVERLPWFTTLAKTWAPDARFVEMHVHDYHPDGTVDVSHTSPVAFGQGVHNETAGELVRYSFVSKQREAAAREMQKVSEKVVPNGISVVIMRGVLRAEAVGYGGGGAAAAEERPLTFSCGIPTLIEMWKTRGLPFRRVYDMTLTVHGARATWRSGDWGLPDISTDCTW